ncbi:GTPase ObgE [Oenococcus sicerae]|uniref:GTPase Obg n=1 Tax=Oenococcus sicerae TaxID=2203724 RepID=A0AAJ1RD75_9LACO|nr:GTPase ObgE [Oenococcus sicerae]MDN6899801.1 GTPase ObgE [Oenococcus sicerae]QAS70488.1 GTPase ObgE [Oenococcus sicerae]
MAFVDQATIEVKAGNGGDGIISFRHEKFVPLGGPFGGDGGKGGDIYFVVDEGLRTLMDFRYNRHFRAKHGEKGGTKGMTGASANDLYVKVPAGTIVSNAETNQQLADLTENGKEFMIAHGGRGGRGNMRFATPANPAPEISENGEPGQVLKVKLELRVLADVGLVGFPSAGKSTFLSVVTAARPKIAAYHFTTIDPNLGMVQLSDGRDFTIADLPGLIKGASKGIGLGFEFLRHVERTRVLLHMVDMSEESGLGITPFEAYQQINEELTTYDPRLLDRPMIIVATKMDLPSSKANLESFKQALADHQINQPVEEISSVAQTGTRVLLLKVADLLDKTPQVSPDKTVSDSDRLYEFKDDKAMDFQIEQDGDDWLIVSDRISRLAKMTNRTTEESLRRFARQLRAFGVDDKLREAGAKDGDMVYIEDADFAFEFED